MLLFLLDLVTILPLFLMIFAVVLAEYGDPEMRKSAQEYHKRYGRRHLFSSF